MTSDRPLSVFSSDCDALRALLDVHVRPRFPRPRILDGTWRTGWIWRGVDCRPTVRMDVNPELDVDVVGDFRQLERYFESRAFEVVLIDPPFTSDTGPGVLGRRYGIGAPGTRAADNSALFAPFLRGARYVLADGGFVLVKIGDQVHSNRYRPQHVRFIICAEAAGFELVDLGIKVRRRPIVDPKWKRVLHFRSAHSYWLAFKKDPT